MGPQDELAEDKYAGAGEADLNKIQDDTISPTHLVSQEIKLKWQSQNNLKAEVKQPKLKFNNFY